MSAEDAEYAVRVMNMTKLYGKPIRVNRTLTEKKDLDVGANIFIGNLDPEVDEKTLYDTFSTFGRIIQTPKIAREIDSGLSRGFGFVSYDSFEAADLAIESMHNRFLANKAITVNYAQKRDGRGELHGSGAGISMFLLI
jgi:splicing factor 3B subunit 4